MKAKRKSKTEEPDKPVFLSVPAAAQLCGVTRNTMYQWVKQGKVSAYQTPGRTNMIRPGDLLIFMRECGLFIPNQLSELAQKELFVEQVARKLEVSEPVTDGGLQDTLSIPQAAKYCGVQRYTMWRWVREGKLEAELAGGGRSYHIQPGNLVKFMWESGMYIPGDLARMAKPEEKVEENIKKENTILIVDGDSFTRAFAVSAFQPSLAVHAAKSSCEALELLSIHEDIHIVHLNLTNLGTDGFSALSVILKMRPDVAVIAVVEDMGKLTEQVLSSGMVVPLAQKPITEVKLRDALGKARKVQHLVKKPA